MKDKTIPLGGVCILLGLICGYALGFRTVRSVIVNQQTPCVAVPAPVPETVKTTLETEPLPVPETPRSLPVGNLHRYPIEKVLRVVDGDTVDVRFYAWEDIVLVKRLRLLGVDTPELRPRKGTAAEKAAEKQAALAALAYVRETLDKAQAIYIVTDWKSDSFG